MSFVDWAVAEYGITREDRLTNASSHHTCFATFDYYAAARAGATTVILTPSVLMMPGSLAELLERERVSVWYSVPTALVQLSLRGDLESRDLRAMRWVLFAGETFPGKHLHRVMRQIPSARFSHVYGSTEVNVCTYYHLPPASELAGPLPIGQGLLDDEDAGGRRAGPARVRRRAGRAARRRVDGHVGLLGRARAQPRRARPAPGARRARGGVLPDRRPGPGSRGRPTRLRRPRRPAGQGARLPRRARGG